MSDSSETGTDLLSSPSQPTVEEAPLAPLPDLDQVDFLLEEIENKIAPLALA